MALQDYELWIGLAKFGCTFKYSDKVLVDYDYLIKKNSMSKSIENDKISLAYI